jgi:site-specific recombinase XerD
MIAPTEIIDQFMQHLLAQDRAETTLKGYHSDLTNFTDWFVQTNGEEFSPDVVTPLDIREFRQYLLTNRRLQPTTINRKLAALSALLNWAQVTGQIETHPGRQVKPIALSPGSPRWLDKKEQYALLRTIEKDLQLARLRYPKRWLTRQRDVSLVVVLLNTGLRLQEALQQRLTDVEISERSGNLTVQGKGRKFRTIPLNSTGRKGLQAWLEVLPAGASEYVWIAVEHEQEGPLSSRSVERVVRRYGQVAGLADLTPHVLRHTFAKNLIDQGVGLERVAALLGHSSLNTTRIYTTPSQRDLAEAVETLAET